MFKGSQIHEMLQPEAENRSPNGRESQGKLPGMILDRTLILEESLEESFSPQSVKEMEPTQDAIIKNMDTI